MKLLLPLVAVGLVGCGSSDRLVPLAVGKKWDYRFRWGVQQKIGKVEVVREVPVANGTGWELRSPMGVARLGYSGNDLVAEQLSGSFLKPALPIGIAIGGHRKWRGWVVTATGKRAAKATIEADESKQQIAGRTRKLNRTVVSMNVEGHPIELATWYAPGEGIMLQQQATNEKVDLALDRVAGE